MPVLSTLGPPNRIVASPDESRAYIFNAGTDDVSVVDLALRKVVATVPVGRGCGRLLPTSEGPQLWVVCDDHMTVIDTRTNEVRATFEVKNGDILDAGIESGTDRLVALTTHSVQVFSAADARVNQPTSQRPERRRQTTLSNDVNRSIPTVRNYNSMVLLVPGAVTNANDVATGPLTHLCARTIDAMRHRAGD